MSALKQVTAAVLERGKATAKDLGPLFPDLTDEQIRVALRNAGFKGQLKRVNSRHGGPKRYEALWGAPGIEPEPLPVPPRPASSVWDYAQRTA